MRKNIMKHTALIILIVLISNFNAISSYQVQLSQNSISFDSMLKNNKTIQNSKIDINSDNFVKDMRNKENEADGPNNTKGSNTFSGIVYIGENVLPVGMIYLLEKDKNRYNSHRYSEVNNGDFEFRELKPGNFTMYVIPEFDFDFFYFPKYFPTYSGNSYRWENSDEEDLSFNLTDFSINLQSYPNPFYGHESISGNLEFTDNYHGLTDMPVPVLLLNLSKEPMDFRIADPNTGKFEFDFLPYGTYYLHPEIPGLQTRDFKFTITEDRGKDVIINFFINNELISTNYDEPKIKKNINTGYINLFLDETISLPIVCELINLSGSSINKNVYYSNEVKINTLGLNAGIYLLKVRTYDNKHVKTEKVYINNYY